ncbi:MAG: Ig-like domain-containing protein, partial [Verrucomicrobiota bacterium]
IVGLAWAGDNDFYALGNLSAGTTVSLKLSQPAYSSLVAVLRVHDAGGNVLANSEPGATNLTYTLPEGVSGACYAAVGASEGAVWLKTAYVVDIDLGDAQPPVITASSWPEEGTTSTGILQVFTLSFSEDLAASTVNEGANYELRSAGADGAFGTADDELYQVQCAPAYSSGLSASYFVPDGPLQPGQYRFVAKRALTDRAGNALAADYARQFAVAGVAGFVVENRSNEARETATVLEPLVEDGVGGGVRAGWGRGRMVFNADSDWWSFTGRAGDWLSLVAETPGVNPWASISYNLYGPDGNWVWGNGTSGSPWQVGTLSLPADGTYTLQVTSGNLSSPDYQFRIVLGHPPLQMESEDNGGVGVANVPSLVLTDGHRWASILGLAWAGDNDFYALGNLSAGTVVSLKLSQPAYSSLAAVLRVYDAGGNVLANGEPGATNLTYTLPEGVSGACYAAVGASEGAVWLKTAYVVDIDLGDAQPPVITASSWPEEGTTSTGILQVFTLSFSEDLAA